MLVVLEGFKLQIFKVYLKVLHLNTVNKVLQLKLKKKKTTAAHSFFTPRAYPMVE